MSEPTSGILGPVDATSNTIAEPPEATGSFTTGLKSRTSLNSYAPVPLPTFGEMKAGILPYS